MWSPIARKAVFLTALVVLVRPVLLPAQEYVYTAAADADEVRGFRVDPVTGALTPVPGTPVTVDWPYAVLGDPIRRSLYVSGSNGRLTRFNVDTTTGSLAAAPPITSPGFPEGALALHPSLPVLYVTDPLYDSVRVYDVSQSCCLVHLGRAPAGNNVYGLVVHPSGRFVYATTASDQQGGPDNSHVWGFAVDPGTGLLTTLPNSPWFVGSQVGTQDAAIDPAGRYLYAVNRLTNVIIGYAIDAVSGQLTPLPGAPFATGGIGPEHIAMTESGRFLYANNLASGTISGFRIEEDGGLVPLPGSPYGAGSPRGIAISGGDRALYTAVEIGDQVRAFAIDAGTGALAPLPGQPFPGGIEPRELTIVRFTPEGAQPTVSVEDTSVTEGDAGTGTASFTVRLANPPPNHVAVGYATSPGTAVAPADFTAASGTVTFPPGLATQQVAVPVVGDVVDEPDEIFSLVLSDPIGGALGRSEAFGRIRDDDGAPVRLSALDRRADLLADLQAPPGPAADVDLYLLRSEPWSSAEVIVDGASGDVGAAGPMVELVSGDFATVVPSSPLGTGSARTLRIENDSAAARLDYVRVRSADCTTDCGADDVYRIRLRDTTGRIARFNQVGSVVTVLALQNRSDQPLARPRLVLERGRRAARGQRGRARAARLDGRLDTDGRPRPVRLHHRVARRRAGSAGRQGRRGRPGERHLVRHAAHDAGALTPPATGPRCPG